MIGRVKICPACSREYDDAHEACAQDGALLVHLDASAGERPEDLVGQVIDGRYRIERIVGRGGMGTVYACRHVVVGKAFAMKVLKPGIERTEEVLQRFIREAQAANAIVSRHICQMTDFGQLAGRGGAFYVVMELLDGFSLTKALKDDRLDRSALEHVFVQIAEALDKAHQAGIIHRDLKPDNVMIVEDEGDPFFVKLVDFGIAKAMQSKAGELTETGVILGTPFYMSPEQARAERLDGRSDVYALGVMMYRAFTGKLPFVADTAMGVLTRHLTERPEAPSRIRDIDPHLERLILRCLEKSPSDRFQSMAEVAAALRLLPQQRAPGATQRSALRDLARTIDERSLRRADELPNEQDPRATRVETPAARAQRQQHDSVTRLRAASIPPALPHPVIDLPAIPGPPPAPTFAAVMSQVAPITTPSALYPASTPPSASYPPASFPPPEGGYPGETNRGLVAARNGSLRPPGHGRRVALLGAGAAIFVTLGAIAAIALIQPERRASPAPAAGAPPAAAAADENATAKAKDATVASEEAEADADDEARDKRRDQARDEEDADAGAPPLAPESGAASAQPASE